MRPFTLLTFGSCCQVRFDLWRPLERPLDVSFRPTFSTSITPLRIGFAAALAAMKCNGRAFSCVGSVLELYRRIGVPYREVGRGMHKVNQHPLFTHKLQTRQVHLDLAAAGLIPFCRCVSFDSTVCCVCVVMKRWQVSLFTDHSFSLLGAKDD
jgi:hypothetical protein